jgi:hypothetical protein
LQDLFDIRSHFAEVEDVEKMQMLQVQAGEPSPGGDKHPSAPAKKMQELYQDPEDGCT